MFNVLPEKIKIEIVKQYNLRRIIVVLYAIIFIQVIIIVTFLPSWFISLYIQKDATSEVAKTEQDILKSEVDKLTSEINSFNSKLRVIKETQTGYSPTEIVTKISEQKNSSVSLKEITYSKQNKDEIKVSLSGVAKERESLLSFVKKLETSKLFEKVDSPISNFTKDKDIQFSLFLILKIKNEK